ncbi:hypothetical protein PFISCL1PPCAC_6309, partial [Pristionchus fissidentatus]
LLLSVLCCQILTSSVVLKTPPTATIAGELLEQCSILRRISSQCGDEGILNCEAAPFTNPSTVFIQLFDVNGNKISEVRGTAQQANAALTCDHLTGQYTANGIVVARASCAQLTSTGSEAPDINVVGR